jgi:hypothetical protein
MSKSITAWTTTLAGALVGFGLAAGAGHAATYDWSWSPGSGSTAGSGEFVTSGDVITSFTGTFDGTGINDLLAVDDFGGNDNQYPLTENGVSFELSDSTQVNIYLARPSDALGICIPNNPACRVSYGTFTATAVPEPATVGLIGVGLAGLLGARRRNAAVRAMA